MFDDDYHHLCNCHGNEENSAEKFESVIRHDFSIYDRQECRDEMQYQSMSERFCLLLQETW